MAEAVRRSTLLISTLLVVGCLLLVTMCSASLGVLGETWILSQADKCLAEVDGDQSADQPSGKVYLPMIVGERWRSDTHATFEVQAFVPEGDGSTATNQTLWLECHAHPMEDDNNVAVIDSVELHR